MGRNLSLLAHLPRLEADGVTHRRDCECVRCDAGYRPTEQERTAARRRWTDRREHEAALRALARRQERARVRAAALGLELRAEEAVTDAHVEALRVAHERADADGRLALLQSLRRAGMPLAAALVEVERRCTDSDGRTQPNSADLQDFNEGRP
jgi:hypothetical protein